MNDQRKDDAKPEPELEVEDLEVRDDAADEVRGGAGAQLPDDGVDAQHNETLLES